VGPKTIAALQLYQKTNGLVADGRADVSGATIKRLMNDHFANLQSGAHRNHLGLKSMPPLNLALMGRAMDEYWQILKK
jgi:hypothetical protein